MTDVGEGPVKPKLELIRSKVVDIDSRRKRKPGDFHPSKMRPLVGGPARIIQFPKSPADNELKISKGGEDNG